MARHHSELLIRYFPELRLLEEEEVWVVGGTIRDLMTGREPGDADLACRKAGEVARRFSHRAGARLVDLGRERFVTLRVVAGSRIYDFSELHGGSIEHDLGRRDFTLNAIAFDLARGSTVDPFDAAADLEARRLRMVDRGNLEDDPLRLLRGIRFAADFDLEIERGTLAAIRELAPRLWDAASERIRAEIDLIFALPRRGRAVRLLAGTGLDRVILGGQITPAIADVVERAGDRDPLTVWSILLDGRTAEELRGLGERLRWSRADRDSILQTLALVRTMRENPPARGDLAILLHDAGKEASSRAATLLDAFGDRHNAEHIGDLIGEGGEALFAMRPLIDGNRAGALLGIDAGPRIGKILRELLEAQIRGEIRSAAEAEEWVVER
ncbi:MAG TPA: hypothetical protein VM534_04105, partial [Thermoanaerobaculia bacterium]|nr:hypothetical protein [Thermoanaerobaculia bacterium]